ncbi:hypothetical protein HYALB_00005111 [Hymenoscyphus albidus]|uniref:Uncharacterized protein n=1 Tax=Hymenoscyphus albidus TaxID=595503 RepID=A0A9N9LZ82_9HELO|nr:hypothetical protein HYALB_00005111 [Hymenoscyphus albidus]
MPKVVILLAALVARGFAQAEFKGSLPIEQCSAVPKCLGELPVESFPQTPDTADTTKPQPLIIGVIVDPTRLADSSDPSCTSGRCIIVDSNEVCDGTQPNCLPFANVGQPTLPCDQSLLKCPLGGILLDPSLSCHLLDNKCPPGGVYVPVLPRDQKAPNWITSCVLDMINCAKGYNLTGVPKWPPPQEDPNKPIPGHPFNPVGLCSKTTPGCDPRTGLVVPYDPNNKCNARYPGCLADDIPSDLVDAGNDPACPKGSVCKIINAVPCYPNQASLPISCMKVDPIPCVIGTLGCSSGTKLTDPVQPCVPNSVGCSQYGIRLPPPPNTQPNDPVIPPGNQALVIAPQGAFILPGKSDAANC